MAETQPPYDQLETDEQARQRAEQSRAQEARQRAAGVGVGTPPPSTAAKASATKTPAHLVADEAKKQEIAALEDKIKELKGDKPVVVQEYPRWRYHADRGPVLVSSKAEDAALGSGFQDSPIVPKKEKA